nr:MAG TPA: hypothetical protein [Caudoviricetes sp.]
MCLTVTNQEFINKCKWRVSDYLNQLVGKETACKPENVFVVWYAKTLQNHKALLATRFTNHYFECTFNGDKGEMYMDVYDKLENKCFKVTD